MASLAETRPESELGRDFGLDEAKLRPPRPHAPTVPRTALIDRLLSSSDVPVVSVVAPPGYGKTTLLTQWAERNEPRSAWVSLDEGDNDPEVLLAYVAAALDRVEPIASELHRVPRRRGLSVAATAVHGLATAMGTMKEPVALVLDHVELLSNDECLDAIAELALHLPRGSRLALATRGDPPLPTARLRNQGDIVEVGVDDLAMSETEASALLDGASVRLAGAELRDLIERTEGWPVGLRLAALAMGAGGAETPHAIAFSGDDRLMADYLRSEVLARLTDEQVTFLMRTSVLDRFCAPLCDAVLDSNGSSDVLGWLERSNLLVVALDRRRAWYRYHHLFRDLLLAELDRSEPDLMPQLHMRAAAWFEANHMPELAIDHAQRGADADRVAELVLDQAQPVWAGGRLETVLRWMEWFEQERLVERYPAVAVHGALIFALIGRPMDAERWADASGLGRSVGVLPDGSTMESSMAYLRANLCRDGIERMRRDAQVAYVGLSPASPYRATMLHAEGLSYLVEGHPGRADAVFVRAFDAAMYAGALPLAALVLAERAIVATERDEWSTAVALAERAITIVEDGGYDDYWTSALVFAHAARISLRSGDLERGRDYAAQAARLRTLLTYALPIVSVQALLELARAYVAIADTGGAREVLRQARDILQQRPNLGSLGAQADELTSKLDAMREAVPGATSLTPAELRLLPLLCTHLSFREIGDRLHVSRHTVKTQAISIYQKLGVSSRSDAIARARAVGLLDP